MGKDSRKRREMRSVGRVSASKTGELNRNEIETLIEEDPTLVPSGPSELQVDDAVLDPQEIEALLAGLAGLLEQIEQSERGVPALTESSGPAGAETPATKGVVYESDAAAVGRSRSHPKLSPFAWLFPDHAGAGRPARHQQGHHLRARRGSGKK